MYTLVSLTLNRIAATTLVICFTNRISSNTDYIYINKKGIEIIWAG
jgi:hypothetical protein